MAHPLGPDGPEREKNRQNATKWFAWLHDQFPSIAFTANWVLLSAGWPETDEHRKRGLEIDMVHVERSDLIFYVGGRMSAGMLEEQARAAKKGLHQVDLTFLGYDAPGPHDFINSPSPLPAPFAFARGLLGELDKALSRIAPLDPELREAFNKSVSERLALAAMGHSLAIMGGPYLEIERLRAVARAARAWRGDRDTWQNLASAIDNLPLGAEGLGSGPVPVRPKGEAG